MIDPTKACPIVLRHTVGGRDVLAFRHPWAGKQFVKGTIEFRETAQHAAQRELFEESGLRAGNTLDYVGQTEIGGSQIWAFYVAMSVGLPDTWSHQTVDDHGHVFDFFWQPLSHDLDAGWDPIFHEAHRFLLDRMSTMDLNDISYL